jgi:hypothetical protein
VKRTQSQIIAFVRAWALAIRRRLLVRKPVESDFKVYVYGDKIAVNFWPTGSLYSFTSEKDIAVFGPVSSTPVVKHGSPGGGTRSYPAAEVLALAFRLATAAARAGM